MSGSQQHKHLYENHSNRGEALKLNLISNGSNISEHTGITVTEMHLFENVYN